MKTKKLIKNFLALSFLVLLMTLPYFVFANPLANLQTAAGNGGYKTKVDSGDEFLMATIIGTVVKTFLSLLGIIFVILILYAGYNWMTAGGNEEKVSKAQKLIFRAVVGLIIIVGAYSIWFFIEINLIAG